MASRITRQRGVQVLACVAASAVIWLAASEVPPVARAWTAFLLVIFPALLVVQAGQLRDGRTFRRRDMYVSSILSLWCLAILTAAVAAAAGYGSADLGLRPIAWETAILWAGGMTLAAEIIVLAGYAAGIRGSNTLRELLPVTPRERAFFGVVAGTAGICEEVMFRGFLLMTLIAATQSTALGAGLAAAAFGIVHAYQDVPGAAQSALLALVLTVPVLITGSLYPSIIAHFAIDIIGGFWLGPALMRRQ